MKAPLRVVLTNFGSLGDLHPFIAIAAELLRRGHHPVLATHEAYRTSVEAEGIEFAGVRPDLTDFGDESVYMRKLMDLRSGPEFLIRQLFLPRLRDSFEDLLRASRGADLIVTHPLTYAGPLVAQKLGMKWVSTVLAPFAFFSACDPPVLAPAPGLSRLRFLGPHFFRPLHRLMKWTVRSWAEPVYDLRHELGLPPATEDPMFEGQFSPHLNLALFSPHLASPQPDWPTNTVVTGFPFYDRQDGRGGVPPNLSVFLAEGPPPLVFTLGSSAVMDAGDFFAVSLRVAQQLGRRAVLLIGRDPRNRPTEPIPEGILVSEYAPYSELLPKAVAVVHQGGIGTTGQALRAGRPMLVMPYNFDQPDNAARAARLGVARVVSRRAYTIDCATRELKALLSTPSYDQRAKEWGRKVMRENGANVAADAVEMIQ